MATWKRNADGLVLTETRPDGGRTEYSYDEGTSLQVINALTRGNVLSIRDYAASDVTLAVAANHTLAGTETPIADRLWTFAYEPLFQQVASVTTPSGRVTSTYYDYHQSQVGSGLGLLERFDAQTGWGSQLSANALFRNIDYDGDGTTNGEWSAQPVLQVQESVSLGDGLVGGGVSAVGTRWRRDEHARLIRQSNIRSRTNSSQDFDVVTFSYWDDAYQAIVGSSATTTNIGLGPLQRQTVLRNPNSTAVTDTDYTEYFYDALGLVQQTKENGNTDSMVTTRRDAIGRVKEVLEPGNKLTIYTFNARGDVATQTVSASGVTPLVTAYAYGLGGVALGTCNQVSATGCAGFELPSGTATIVPRTVSSSYRTGAFSGGFTTSFATVYDPAAHWSVAAINKNDETAAMIDSAGALSEYNRNGAGLVVRTKVRGKGVSGHPNATANNADVFDDYVYDRMGRMVRHGMGAPTVGGTDVRETFYKYDRLGRLYGEENMAPIAETGFSETTGTVDRYAYNLEDDLVMHRTTGRVGSVNATRNTLRFERTEFNEIGVPRYVHRYASATLPATTDVLPKTAAVNSSNVFSEAGFTGDSFATTEYRYDNALRVVQQLDEGVAGAFVSTPGATYNPGGTTYSYNGFGLSSVRDQAAVTEIFLNPAAPGNTITVDTRTINGRELMMKRTLRPQGTTQTNGVNAAQRISYDVRTVDHRGLLVKSVSEDAGITYTGTKPTSTWTYDGLYRAATFVDPTGRGAKISYGANSGRGSVPIVVEI